MNNTNITSDDTNERDEKQYVIIIVVVVIIGICYFCNRNEEKDRQDMQAKADRAQGRLEIRYG